MPVAWMLSSNTKSETITYFLFLVQFWNPDVWPTQFMTDCDQAQILALQAVYPQTKVLLCKWHILHAIQSHFWTNQFLELWVMVKKLISTSNLANFMTIWDKISSNLEFPKSFIDYFNSRWVPVAHMWSGVSRRSCNIYSEGDTNMLLEAYVHFWYFLKKRN